MNLRVKKRKGDKVGKSKGKMEGRKREKKVTEDIKRLEDWKKK